jgi:trimethylamine--corrinoid protein Co-methyltransferase
MIDTARLGLVTDLAVPPQAGATSPATLAGTLVQSVAETLACLAVVNLVNAGAPMTFAAWPFITDLRTGSFTGGSGEQALISAAAAQMGNFYNLPTSVGSGMTDAKTPDAQYGMEKALSYSLAAHAGVNRLCEFGGMIGSLMGCSFEAMVLDNEVAGMISRTLRGIEVSDDTLALDLIHQQTLEPGHFLGASHTLEVMESEYIYPEVFDRNPTDAWQKQGSKDVMVKAGEVATQILDNHYPNYFGRANDAKLRDHYSIVLPESAMRAG